MGLEELRSGVYRSLSLYCGGQLFLQRSLLVGLEPKDLFFLVIVV